MKVRFKTVKLRRCYVEYEAAVKRWGAAAARRYVERVEILHACHSTQDLRRMPPLRFHELKGDRAGQYSIMIVDRYRLIVSFPNTEPGTVVVEEVTQHYGD